MDIDKSLLEGKYYSKHRRYPNCPFCGFTMEFDPNLSYPSNSQWMCKKCYCKLPNEEDFTDEYLSEVRKKKKSQLKRDIKWVEEYLSNLKYRLSLWGKYMTEEEKVKLFVEVLEESK